MLPPACLPAACRLPLRNLISGVPRRLGLAGVACPSGRPAGATPVTDPSRGRAGCRRDGRASGTGVRQGREHRCPGTRSAGSRRCSTPGSPRGRHSRARPVGRVRGPHRLPNQGLGEHRAGPERGGGAPTRGVQLDGAACRRRVRHLPPVGGHRPPMLKSKNHPHGPPGLTRRGGRRTERTATPGTT